MQMTQNRGKSDAYEMEIALTAAFDWVRQPDRAPLMDQLNRDAPNRVPSVMRMMADHVEDDLPDIAFAWRLEARVREEGLDQPQLTVDDIKEVLAEKYCVCKSPLPRVETVPPWHGVRAFGQWRRQCSGCGRRRRGRASG